MKSEHKICLICEKEFPATLEFFHRNRSNKNGLNTYCKRCANKCVSVYQKEHLEQVHAYKLIWTHKNKDKTRNHYLKNRFGIDSGWYDAALAAQKGVCAICGKPETAPDNKHGGAKRLAVDHNHKTGKVRGLLCMKCNHALGNFEENKTTMANAIIYLSERDG